MSDIPDYSKHKLKPCPLCGEGAHWCGEANEEDLHTCHHVTCLDCGYNLDVWHKDTDHEDWDSTLKSVAQRWNTRTGEGQ